MHKFIIPIFSCLIVSGCMTYGQALQELQYANPHDLCYAATDNRPFRKGEKRAANEILQEKSIECNWAAYGQMHEARQAAAMNNLYMSQQLMRSGQATSVYQSQPSPFHSYRINGRNYNCTTLGTSTTCN